MQTTIYAIERFNRQEWFDLFCSQKCCRTVYAAERPEVLTNDDLYDKTGIKLNEQKCFYCGIPFLLTKKDF